MFRVLLLAATAVALAGCAGSETATQATFRADDATCKSYGAAPGTDDYVRCRLPSICRRPMLSEHPRGAGQKALVEAELIKTLLRWGNAIGVTAIASEIG